MYITAISRRNSNITRCLQPMGSSSVSVPHSQSSFEKTITKNIESFIKRVNDEVPEYGNLFGKIVNEFSNTDKDSSAKLIKFTLKPSMEKGNQTGRIFKIDISSGSGNIVTPKFLTGTKAQILEYLQDPKTPAEIKRMIQDANKKLFKMI